MPDNLTFQVVLCNLRHLRLDLLIEMMMFWTQCVIVRPYV